MRTRTIVALVGSVVAVSLMACAAGDARFTSDAPAGFWQGLWHGAISLVALIIGFFVDGVEIYERDNSGTLYDIGFMLGILIVSGGGGSTASRRARGRKERQRDEEWEEIASKVEAKVRRKIRLWAEAEPDEDWDVVEDQAAEKLKRKVRAWAEEP